MMLLSFIIPFYGSAALLKRCLDSLVMQTDGDFEAIVIDDRSPECGRDLVAQYDNRFHYILQPRNCGPYQARVRGVEAARGDYIVDIDGDDYVLPQLVAELKRAIVDARADIVIYNIETDTAGVIAPHWFHFDSGSYSPERAMGCLVKMKLHWNYWSKAIRRSIIQKTWEIVPELKTTTVFAPDDYCAVVPMVLASEKIEVIPYVGHRYWQGAGSICRGITLAKVRRALRDTREARRLVSAFARRTDQSAPVRANVATIARMIVRWWVREYLQSLKSLVGKRFHCHR